MHSYIAIDLETSGLNPKRDKIIEIGALKIVDDEIIDTYATFVNPRRTLEPHIEELTHITEDMLLDAPGIETIMPELIAFCGEGEDALPILGHHVIFDYSFLKHGAVNLGFSFEKMGIDTLSLCRTYMPETQKKNLNVACAYFHIPQKEAHRALADAKAAHDLYQKMAMRYETAETALFLPKKLIYKVKKEQPATKSQKEHLRELLKYHRISLTVQIDYLSKNEISRVTDKIISQYGRI